MQTLQRQAMLKRLQELQRQQQLQELGDAREHNYFNQQSALSRQMPLAGQMNLGPQNTSLSLQGFPTGFYPQPQSQDLKSVNLAPPQLDFSLYGTPVASARNNFPQHNNNLQGLSNIYANGVAKARDNNQAENHLMGFNNSFLNYPQTGSSNQFRVPERALMSKQVTHEKNLFGQVPLQGFNSGDLQNFPQPQSNTVQANASIQQDGSWAGTENPHNQSSQSSSSLDALERKFLFNTDDDISLGGASIGTEGVKDMLLEQNECENSFPSLQSGSWSALMQCAVGEASSSETGLQEEWSGLSFQIIEPSVSNHQPMNFMESGNQQAGGWVDNNVQSPSSQLFLNNSNTSSFPGFQQSAIKFPTNQKDGLRSDSSPESVQQSPRHGLNWLDCNTQQNLPAKGNLNYFGHKNAVSTTTYNNENAANKSWPGDINAAMHEEKGSDLNISSNSMFRLGLGNEGSQFNYFEPLPSSGHATDQAQPQKFHPVKQHSNSPSINKLSWNVAGEDHHMGKVATNHNQVASQGYEEQHDCYQTENSSGSHLSNASEYHTGDPEVRQNRQPYDFTSQSGDWRSLKLSGQVSQGRSSNESYRDAGELEKRNLRASGESGNTVANIFPSFDTSGGTSGQNFAFQERHSGLIFPPSRVLHSNSLFSSPSSPQTERTAHQGSSNVGLQLQKSQLAAAFPASQQPPQATSNRVPQFNNASSPGGITRSAFPYPFAQEFPALEAALVTRSFPVTSLSQQVRSPSSPRSISTNVPSQNLSGSQVPEEPSNLSPYADSRKKIQQNTLRPMQGRLDENAYRGQLSQEVGKEKNRNRTPDQRVSPELPGQVSDSSGSPHGQNSGQNSPSQANAIFSGSLMSRVLQQDVVRAQRNATQFPAVAARDLEAFGHSLKPSNLHQNYALLQQVFSNKRVLEKSGQNVQQIPTFAGNQKMYGQKPEATFLGHNGMNEAPPRRDSNMLSFSSNVGEDQTGKAPSLHSKDSQQEIVTPRNDSESHHNLPTSPVWFKNYGTVGNRQMAQVLEATAAKNTEHGVLPGKPLQDFRAVASLLNAKAAAVSHSAWPNKAMGLSIDRPSSSSAIPMDVGNKTLTVQRPKKRKFEALPWHKEAAGTSKRLHDTSSAELWAEATSRLIDKVDFGGEVRNEMQPSVRAKRRIVLTTELMQQLFRPAPSSILKLDAKSNSDTVVYSMARLALGDACNLTSNSGSDGLSSTGNDMKCETSRTSEKTRHYRSVEDFTKRIERLESDFLRLEKSASVFDIALDYEDLEKNSVYNRFARFHYRGQNAAADSSTTTSNVAKQMPMKYVTPYPMPQAVPEGADCLKL